MQRKPNARGLLLIAACILALVMFRSGPVGVRLAVDQGGFSFQFKSAAAKVAFDIGQECSKSDGCGLLK
ncbi:MAG: hypothetical protein WDN24_14975 [Sphingomonas sp.]